MSRNGNPPVLAVGIDAGDRTFVRRMIEQGEMPSLKSLLVEGRWIDVDSPTHMGSVAVWPSFVTGEDVATHGTYSEWCWEPSTMSLSRFTGRDLKPFWEGLADAGYVTGILGVPFMPLVGLSEGFEVGEWGAGQMLESGNQFGPASLGDLVTKETARQAVIRDRVKVSGPEDYENLKRLTSESMEGVKLRGQFAAHLLTETKPDISVIVFTETHESGHCLWQTVEPEHELYNDGKLRNLSTIRPTLREIYQEVDRQIGKLVAAVGPDATVLVFALHGMQPALAVPTFLGPLMCDLGFSRLATWRTQSGTERLVRLIRAVKSRAPAGLKQLYYKKASPAAIVKWAGPTLLAQYDWSQTRAFALVAEHHGSIRVNLIGREAKGIVPVEEYEDTCRQVEQALRSLTSQSGKPLAKQIIRTAESAEKALKHRLPDVIVHWEDEVFKSPLRIKGSAIESAPDGARYMSQHNSEGFCILKGARDFEVGGVIDGKDLGRLLTKILRESSHGNKKAAIASTLPSVS